jgi:hypothetical protein
MDRSLVIICLNTFKYECEFPATVTPDWAPKVERWYQLDQAAYSIAQSYSHLKAELDLGGRSDLILLASPLASNATDRSFATSGASSPSKFVHTLPNVRAVPLLQVMDWAGPLLCVQNDPHTVKSALEQALLYFETAPDLECIWVITFDDVSSTFRVLTRRMWGANPQRIENGQAAFEQL